MYKAIIHLTTLELKELFNIPEDGVITNVKFDPNWNTVELVVHLTKEYEGSVSVTELEKTGALQQKVSKIGKIVK